MQQVKKIKTIKISFDRIEVGNMQTAWTKSFKALLESSEKIMDTDPIKDFEYFRVKLMLRGMALECHLKTLLISKGLKMIDAEGKLKTHKLKQHNLTELSKFLGMIISDEETKLLNILSDSIEVGRYPVTSKGTKVSRFWIVPTFENLFYSFIKKVDDLIDSESANA